MSADTAEPPPDCPLCPRLASFRHEQRALHPDWFNAPVPCFGDPDAWLAIVGLAPGLQGANRTGRPFTGDFAGVLLYETLLKHGLAEGQYGARPDDGLRLIGATIVNAVRCVPPQNKPTPEEIRTCRAFLEPALERLPNLRVVVALGQIAHQSAVKALGGRLPKARFGHGAEHVLPSGITLVDSYHCSRYNQNTRVLTAPMFEAVFARALALAAPPGAANGKRSEELAVIRQVAALPYRTEEDGRTSVLLITSRETRRWVIPKGNLIAGLDPHLAAAHEAFTEAGVSGNPAQLPIGFYRYAKRRKNGILRTLTVDVFPLGVTAQAEEWPEQDERELRWCTPEEAADAVEEGELKAILAGFRAPTGPGRSTPFRAALRARRGAGRGVLGWFQSLLPSQGRFFEQFEAHAALLVAGAEALARLLTSADGVDAQIREIMVREQQADDITREVYQDVRRIFLTPFDRSAITGLIGAMDDAIDQMNETAKAIAIFEVKSFEPQMRAMSGHVVQAARTTAEAIPLLRSIAANADRLNTLTARVVSIEGDAEEANDTGIRDLFRACQGEPMRFVVGQEIYAHLGRIVDRIEDVANEVQGLVIDHV